MPLVSVAGTLIRLQSVEQSQQMHTAANLHPCVSTNANHFTCSNSLLIEQDALPVRARLQCPDNTFST